MQLARLVPASGSANLSDYNTTHEIQDDAQLRALIVAGTLLLNDGATTLTQAQSLQYMTPVAAPTVLNPMTTRGDVIVGADSPAGSPERLAGVNGAYLRSGGSANASGFVRVLDVDGIVADVSVGTSIDASAIIQMNSTSKGFLLPRMTETQMLAVSSPATGLLIYNTTTKRSHFWDGLGWRSVSASIATVITVAVDGSGDFTSVQDALDSILDAADDNRYVVEVTPGIYTEDISLKDYVSVNGTGWDTILVGTVTATNPVEMTMVGLRVDAVNAPAFVQTGAAADGESDLLGCFLGSVYDDTVAGGVVRRVIDQDSGVLFLYKECEVTLVVNDTVHNSASTIQTIYHTHGTDQITLESFNTWETVDTDNSGNTICGVFNTNTHVANSVRILGYRLIVTLTGTGLTNMLNAMRNVGGNGDFMKSRRDFSVVTPPGENAVIVMGYSSGATVKAMLRQQLVVIVKSGVSDAHVYIGAATGVNDYIDSFAAAYGMNSDTQPGRYTADGALGTYLYQVTNDFGSTEASGLFNGSERNSDVTDWGNVSAALGGQAGANANYVFKSNGSGGGSMVKNNLKIAKLLTVGTSGDVDYASIATAVQAAIDGGATAAAPWEIRIFPGAYVEPPMTVTDGIILVTDVDSRIDNVFVSASN